MSGAQYFTNLRYYYGRHHSCASGSVTLGSYPSWGMSIPKDPNCGETEADRVTYEEEHLQLLRQRWLPCFILEGLGDWGGRKANYQHPHHPHRHHHTKGKTEC